MQACVNAERNEFLLDSAATCGVVVQYTYQKNNAVCWDVTLCCSSKNRRFGGRYRPHHQGEKNPRAKNVSSNLQLKHTAEKLAVFLRSVLQLLVTSEVPSSLILYTLMMEAILFSETSVLRRATRHRIPKTTFFVVTALKND
jgi:hypothetical protein